MQDSVTINSKLSLQLFCKTTFIRKTNEPKLNMHGEILEAKIFRVLMQLWTQTDNKSSCMNGKWFKN